jgi:mannose-6-phosphate isomerase-like protein (cupin superfamily)
LLAGSRTPGHEDQKKNESDSVHEGFIPQASAVECRPDTFEENGMASTTRPGYIVRRLSEAPTVPCPCGRSTRPLTGKDDVVCNLHVVFITDSVKHYHRQTTEVYYILAGRGKMELNDDVIDVEPGTVVYIEPYTAHRLFSVEGVQTIVFGVPAYQEDDEFFVTEAPTTEGT